MAVSTSSMRVFVATLICSFFFFCSGMGGAILSAAEQSSRPTEDGSAGEVDSEIGIVEDEASSRKSSLVELTPKTTALRKKLLDMEADFSNFTEIEYFQERLLLLSEERNALEEQFHVLKVDPQENLQQLSNLQIQLNEMEHQAQLTVDEIGELLAQLDVWMNYWNEESSEIVHLREGLGSTGELSALKQTFTNLQAVVEEAQQKVEEKLLPLVDIQQKAGEMTLASHRLNIEMKELFQERFQLGQHAPFLFSKEYFEQFNSGLWLRTLKGFGFALKPDGSALSKYKLELSYSAVAFVVLFLLIRLGRRKLGESPRMRIISNRALEVSLVVSLTVLLILAQDLPSLWLAGLLLLVSLIRLSRELLSDIYQRNTFLLLAVVLFLTDFMGLIGLPLALLRLYVFSLSAILLANSLFFGRLVSSKVNRPPWLVWSARTFTVLMICVLVSELAGEPELAFYLFLATLRSLFAAVFIWVVYQLSMALLEAAFHSVPVAIIQNSARAITLSLRPALILFASGLLIIFTLVSWQVFATPAEAIETLLGYSFTFGETRISIGLVIGAVFVLYLSYGISKTLEALMLGSLLTRRNIDRGVQISITRLMRYGILLVGFLLVLGMLGFSMTNLTILGGALGVGIGFGLQAIVNNFASGLILLFERPVKIGDIITVGTDMGEVKELGLRATIVQTFDKAEIVIPNSDLITGQVTNWTLQARQVRVRVPVGVAYGSDVEKVQDILMRCATEHPQILSSPAPLALFKGFGASSLDFELRAFVADISDRVLVQSELNIAINVEFGEAGIEISFPQRDLHIRTVHPDALGKIVPPESAG